MFYFYQHEGGMASVAELCGQFGYLGRHIEVADSNKINDSSSLLTLITGVKMYFTHLLLAAFSREPKRTAPILPHRSDYRFNLPRKHLLRAADAGGYEFARSQRFFPSLERR